jgi:hypothetical protein
MNNKEIMQDMVNFAIWIVKNANNFDFLKNSNGVKTIASAKNEEDVKNGLIQIEQEVNDNNKMKELYSMYSQSKNKIQMNKRGSKIDYLVNKFEGGGITIYTDDGPIIKKSSSFSSSSTSNSGSRPLTIYGNAGNRGPILNREVSTPSKVANQIKSNSSNKVTTKSASAPIAEATIPNIFSIGSGSKKGVDYLEHWEPLTSDITKLNDEFDKYNFYSNEGLHYSKDISTNDELIKLQREIPYFYDKNAGTSSAPYRDRKYYFNNHEDGSGYEEITYPGYRTFRRSYDANGNLINEGFYTRVRKHDDGGSIDEPIKVHQAWSHTPRTLSFMWAYLTGKSKTLPQRRGTTVNRSFARIQYPGGTTIDRIHREDGNGDTYRIVTPKRDTMYEYNGELFFPGSEMYDRYENAWEAYGVHKNGGKLNKFANVDYKIKDTY